MTHLPENLPHHHSEDSTDQPAPLDTQSSGLRAALGQNFDAWQAVGGVRGIVESNVPALLFVVTFVITRDIQSSVIAPFIFAVAAVLVRLIQRKDPTPAIGGVMIVAISVAFVWYSGRGEAYFLPGILSNAAYAVLVGASLIVSRPALGYVIGSFRGDMSHWRVNPHPAAVSTRKQYTRITWVWFTMFAFRVLIQIPFYAGGYTVVLSVIKIVCGPVLFCAVLWATWMLIRQLPPVESYLSEGSSPVGETK